MAAADPEDPDASPDSAWDQRIANEFAELLGLEDSRARSQQLERLCTQNPELTDSLRSAFDRAERRDALPTQIGDYRVVGELGRGGMGVVYAGEHGATAQPVAIKCMLAQRGLPAAMLERFEREARLNAALTHPNCVFVYDSGVFEGQPFFVMERLPGPDLETFVAEHGPLPLGTAIRHTLDILDGLTAAHDLGILHRDVKPGNCLLTADSRVKVADFGLSKALDSSLALTAENAQLGTPGYASPEQLRGDPLDFRADVFSCAATLYLLLTGQRAFAGNTTGAVLESTFAGRVAPLDPALGLPARLEQWLRRCLANSPSDRPADLRTMRAELEGLLPENQQPAHPFERIVAFFADVALTWIGTLLLGVAAHLLLPDPWCRTFSFGFALAINLDWPSWGNHAATLLLGWIPYHTVSTRLLGGSIGQRVLGLRVMQQDSLERPGLHRLLLRNLVLCTGQYFAAPVLVAGLWIATGLVPFFADFLSVLTVGAVLFAPALLRHRQTGRTALRGLHELVSGTRTVSHRGSRQRGEQPIETETPTAAARETPLPVFHSYVDLHPIAGIADCYGATAPALQRRVFLSRVSDDLPGVSPGAAPRVTRVRQISITRSDSDAFAVLAQPAGVPLLRHLQHERIDWRWTRRVLAQLLDELLAARDEGTLPAHLASSQVFVGPQARLQFMPWQPEAGPTFDGRSEDDCVRFVAHVADRCLTGKATPNRPVPRHADTFVRTLRTMPDLDTARRELRAIAERRADLEPRQRLLSLAGIVFFLIFAASTLTAHLANEIELPIARALGHLELRLAAADAVATGSPEHDRLAAAATTLQARIEDRADSSPVLIASGSSRALTTVILPSTAVQPISRMWSHLGFLDPVELWPKVLRRNPNETLHVELNTQATQQEQLVERERAFIARSGDPFELERDAQIRAEGRRYRLGIALGALLACALLAFASRGGLGLGVTGIAVVTPDGQPAPRWRAALRSSAPGIGLALLVGLAELLIHAGGALQFVGETLALGLVCGVLGYPFLHYRVDRREWQDRLAGTWLVPR
ncbi:MAG: protein kinase [bacterium]|nr:protein kinase [bacterium]